MRVSPLFFLFLSTLAYAQRCPEMPMRPALEEWISTQEVIITNGDEDGEIRIPVVVHYLLDSAAMPINTLQRARDQVSILNEDFNRLNPDSVLTFPEFRPVAGSMNIKFMLATFDPEGNPTNGIVTVYTEAGQKFTIAQHEDYKPLSPSWPTDQYLNIWVVRSDNRNIGYGTFPDYQLSGLEGLAGDPTFDGVTIDEEAFGLTSGDYGLGRTLTHEVGHYFGLRHIWGDSYPCAPDFVDDTPDQRIETSFCPTIDPESCVPGIRAMYQNYMDYTPDRCMNLFTKGQITRMTKVLQNARYGLVNNFATVAPEPEPTPADTIKATPITRTNNPQEAQKDPIEIASNTPSDRALIYNRGPVIVVVLDGIYAESKVVLYNLSGQVIYAGSGSTEVDLSQQPASVYIVGVLSEKKKIYKRVIN